MAKGVCCENTTSQDGHDGGPWARRRGRLRGNRPRRRRWAGQGCGQGRHTSCAVQHRPGAPRSGPQLRHLVPGRRPACLPDTDDVRGGTRPGRGQDRAGPGDGQRATRRWRPKLDLHSQGRGEVRGRPAHHQPGHQVRGRADVRRGAARRPAVRPDLAGGRQGVQGPLQGQAWARLDRDPRRQDDRLQAQPPGGRLRFRGVAADVRPGTERQGHRRQVRLQTFLLRAVQDRELRAQEAAHTRPQHSLESGHRLGAQGTPGQDRDRSQSGSGRDRPAAHRRWGRGRQRGRSRAGRRRLHRAGDVQPGSASATGQRRIDQHALPQHQYQAQAAGRRPGAAGDRIRAGQGRAAHRSGRPHRRGAGHHSAAAVAARLRFRGPVPEPGRQGGSGQGQGAARTCRSRLGPDSHPRHSGNRHRQDAGRSGPGIPGPGRHHGEDQRDQLVGVLQHGGQHGPGARPGDRRLDARLARRLHLPADRVRRPTDHRGGQQQPFAVQLRQGQRADRRDRQAARSGVRRDGLRRTGQADHAGRAGRAVPLGQGGRPRGAQRRRGVRAHRLRRTSGSGLPGAAQVTTTLPTSVPSDVTHRVGRHQVSLLRRLLKQPSAAAALTVVVALVLIALAAPLITWAAGTSPTEFHSDAVDPALGGLPRGTAGGISTTHWLGVEPGSGRDILARVVYGARVSLLIAMLATGLSVVLGTALGLAAGYFGGWTDALVGRLMDLLMSFPSLIFMIALISAAPGVDRQLLLVVVLGFFGWPYVGRIVRGQAMVLARGEFVAAARVLGASRRVLLVREVLPNVTGPILVVATMAIPSCIATEAGLSFLGVGVAPPTPSWGQMIASAVPWYAADPVYFLIPGVFLFVTVLAFNVLGDAIQDALDPRSRRR
ncbi:ABC transporter permease subunit [Streptomyces lunaelactis]|nr:ABC transporter permease subunit [Streptomyces lunaelactis]NUK15166.1 ABC transporter permease subunit [Streptomyces lunaelactis]NUK33351.1 ABC transporter permease subunit [Streptomyces lunaelactis]NUK41107.1 ABC transporter permease subunit [Streptomyces lunaelactis]NUK92314.1 ABC transporter permease subunit [Streptomyces lunaelactis]